MDATQVKPYIFHNDPGHGWLGVPVVELMELGIADQISAFSYLQGGIAYLEEDEDAGRFLRAKFGQDITGAELGRRGLMKDVYEDPTPIRDYPHYSLDQL